MPDIAVIHPHPSIAGPGECGASDVVSLEAVVLKDGHVAALTPPATLRCAMAEAMVHWIRDEVAPAVTEAGLLLRGIVTDASFECRPRNRIAGAQLSEHGRANALDLRALSLADGRVMALTDREAPAPLRDHLRWSACTRFTTVLGPGSDGYHESHIHLDLAERRHGYRICQWRLREGAEVAKIPMPTPRPVTSSLKR